MTGIEILIIFVCFIAGYWLISKILTILHKPPVDIGGEVKNTFSMDDHHKD